MAKNKDSKQVVRLESGRGRETKHSRTVRRLITKGWSASEIADKLAPDDPRKRKIIRTQVRAIIANDEEIQAMKGLAAKGVLIEDMDEVAEAVVRRAKKGNIPAAKLAMEASGFYNPRVEHEHSGDIQITIKSAPRPDRVVDEKVDDLITDATVVEGSVE